MSQRINHELWPGEERGGSSQVALQRREQQKQQRNEQQYRERDLRKEPERCLSASGVFLLSAATATAPLSPTSSSFSGSSDASSS